MVIEKTGLIVANATRKKKPLIMLVAQLPQENTEKEKGLSGKNNNK